MVKFNLVSFLSEGPPHDNALNLIDNKDLLIENAKSHFDNIEVYTPRKMKELNLENYIKDYEVKGLSRANYGLSRIGNCAWKPKIILLELDKMNDGDILVYRDSNIKKYQCLGNYNNIKQIVTEALEICKFDFFVPVENNSFKLKHFTKTNVIKELGNNHPFTYEFPNIFAGLLTIIRKSKISMELVNEWCDASQVESWIDINQYGNLDKNFRYSCNEQSILGVIIANWIRNKKYNIPLKYPFIGYKNRVIQNKFFITNYEYLNLLNMLNINEGMLRNIIDYKEEHEKIIEKKSILFLKSRRK